MILQPDDIMQEDDIIRNWAGAGRDLVVKGLAGDIAGSVCWTDKVFVERPDAALADYEEVK